MRRFPCFLGLFVVSSLLAMPTAPAQQAPSDLVKQGEYLAKLGDCSGCHTKSGGPPMAGGKQIQTPYGTISSPNITPDRSTGIGDWTDEDFYKLMHEGIDRSGQYVYPVMPYDHYTKVTRQDVLAIKAWLFSLPPIDARNGGNRLAFPYDVRAALGGWRILFFKPGTFVPDPSRSAEQNRGAYLVEGLGHCGSCHTPRNFLSGSETGKALAGGEIKGQGWFAPNITSDVREGIGGWSDPDLTAYLKTGIAPGHAIASGPMVDVIHDSLRYFTDQDLAAVVSYLKSVPARETYTDKQVAALPGAGEYLDHCGFCHQPDGKGIEGEVPPLAGDGTVLAGGPEDVVRAILGGHPATGSYASMPGFATILSSAQIADIANHVRTAWGNGAPAVASLSMVDNLARQTSTMLSGTKECDPVTPPAIAAAVANGEIRQMLQKIDEVGMRDEVDAILKALPPASAAAAPADIVNGLTAAWCPIAKADTSRPPEQRLLLLQRFAAFVYTGLRDTRTVSRESHVAPAKN